MESFHYEWWNVEVKYPTGTYTTEFKARSKEHAIRQIEKDFAFTNSAKNLNAPFAKRRDQMIEVYWDTLKLDRVGYQRRF